MHGKYGFKIFSLGKTKFKKLYGGGYNFLIRTVDKNTKFGHREYNLDILDHRQFRTERRLNVS